MKFESSEEIGEFCVLTGRELGVNGMELYLSNKDMLLTYFMPNPMRQLANLLGRLK